jgi:hypothetical protein
VIPPKVVEELYTLKSNIPFGKNANRFNAKEVFCGQSYKFDVPGPGHYQPHKKQK